MTLASWRGCSAFFGILACTAAHAAPVATITVNARHMSARVQPLVFGHNIEASDAFGIFGNNHEYVAPTTGNGLWNPETQAPAAETVALSKEIGTSMLRYPGGCLVHGFDWKASVGPIVARPHAAFGIDEFIAACRRVGAEPLMMVSDYTGTPQDAADLVEYLNAPADAAHPWAQKRAAGGHPQPYAVRYFEMGNESDHGNHELLPHQRFTGETYGEWFIDCARRMRAIDPKIKLGALMGTGTGPFDPWNAQVLTRVKGLADFIIVHTYS